MSIDPALRPIIDKVEAAQRLTQQDGETLYASRDLFTIGMLADRVRRRLHGRKAYYNINRHINYTNYCVLRCKFCSFYRPYPKPNAAPRDRALPVADHGRSLSGLLGDTTGGYELSIDDIVARARQAADMGATEVHIVGGLHPRLPFEYYKDMCRAIREACPQLHIKAFTAIEIIHFARIARPRRTIRQVLAELREAGLGSLPGGGAEIFDDRVHDEAFRNKVGEKGWFDVHRIAHEMGIFSNATMLYGHIETPAERIRHLIKLREHQDASLASRAAHFNCLVPLSFVPEGSALANLPGPTGLTDLKTLAIARLMVDNIPHIKAFWPMHSVKLAQVALSFGVDDLDGTVVWYDITKREAGPGNTQQHLTVDTLKRLIREAGFEPVERDTLYNPVVRSGEPVALS